MKKTLKLSKNGTNYELKDAEEILLLIVDKKINGNEIFEKVYKNLPENTKSEITIEQDGFELDDTGKIKLKEDELVLDQVKSLFQKIDEAISNAILAGSSS